MTVSPGEDSAQDRTAVILTPDQRVRAAGPEEPDGAELPAGTLTFLLTDIEGSTRLWETEPGAMEVALQQHDRLLAEVIEGHGGAVVTVRGEGDSFFAVFQSAVSAVEAAGMCQLRLGREEWPGSALRVRMGLHTGEVRVRGGDHVDYTPINRCARVRAAAMAGRCCSPRRRATWWRAVWAAGSG
jgi:class 3 adenylate cyclase